VFVFATNCINIALVQSFWKKIFYFPFFETLQTCYNGPQRC